MIKPCAGPRFTGQLIVRTVPDTRNQEARLQQKRYEVEAEGSHLDGQPRLWREHLAALTQSISTSELGIIFNRVVQQSKNRSAKLTVADNKKTAVIDYGNNHFVREKMVTALAQRGCDPIDTEGDLLSVTQKDGLRVHIEALGPRLEQEIGTLLRAKKLTIATAESCTGGLASSRLTDVSGSSDYVRFNAVTYSNSAKHKMLGVSETLLAERGPYNAETAAQMAEGIRKTAGTNIGLSFTGLAGSHGMDGVDGGTVFIGLAGLTDKPVVKKVVLDSAIPRARQKQIFAEAGLCFLKAYLNHDLVSDGHFNA